MVYYGIDFIQQLKCPVLAITKGSKELLKSFQGFILENKDCKFI